MKDMKKFLFSHTVLFTLKILCGDSGMWPLVLSILVCCIPHSFDNKSDYCFSQCLVYCKQLTNISMNYVVVEAFFFTENQCLYSTFGQRTSHNS